MRSLSVIFFFFIYFSGACAAVPFTSEQEERARAIFRAVKCPVCEGQAVADSDSDTAKDFRGVIREQIRAGKSDAEIYDFFRERYGDEILLFPPDNVYGFLLNYAPFLIFGSGLLIYCLKKTKRMKKNS